MGARGSRSVLIPALTLLLLASVTADVVRRVVSGSAPEAAASQPSRGGTVAGRPDGAPPPRAAAVTETDRLDSASRVVALARIGREGDGTYLPAMLAENDSVLHRWADERRQRPLRVAVLRDDTVPGFRESFVGNVTWAIGRWNGVGLPVWLAESPDSGGADIVVSWTNQLDSNRTGRTDLTWQRRGPIVKVHVILATHLPDGRRVVGTQMVALALHELGHAIGLGHSPVRSDALYPETSATDLTSRDRLTALLLYAVPPGSFP